MCHSSPPRRRQRAKEGTCGVPTRNPRQRDPSHAISRHQSSNLTLALHSAHRGPPPSPAGLDGAAWWENDIQSAVRPIQAKLANDSSPPLRFRGSERYHHHHPPKPPKGWKGEGGRRVGRREGCGVGPGLGPLSLRSGPRWVNSLPLFSLAVTVLDTESTKKREKNAYSADQSNFPGTSGRS